jgi:hypothetical protein
MSNLRLAFTIGNKIERPEFYLFNTPGNFVKKKLSLIIVYVTFFSFLRNFNLATRKLRNK